MPKEKRVCTFSKTMTLEEAELEKRKGTAIGKSLIKSEEEYKKRRKK